MYIAKDINNRGAQQIKEMMSRGIYHWDWGVKARYAEDRRTLLGYEVRFTWWERTYRAGTPLPQWSEMCNGSFQISTCAYHEAQRLKRIARRYVERTGKLPNVSAPVERWGKLATAH